MDNSAGLDFLSPEELKVLSEVIQGAQRIKKAKGQAKQIRKMEPVETWLEDEYFVGKSGLYLYDYWKQEIIDIFGTNRGKYNEVIVTGGIGTGKSTFALYCMMRKLYELSCYENVPALFKLMPNTLLSIMYFSVSKTQAEMTGFGQFRNIIDESPYFQEMFARDERLQSMLKFPENLFFLFGSSSGHAIGMNMIGSILDEANFFQQGAQDPTKSAYEYSKIAQLYSSIVNRAKSRFMSYGVDHSLSILVSSNTTATSFTEERIKKSVDDPHTKIINARLWDVKPKGAYSSKKFFVFEGSDLIDPFVVREIADIYQVTDSVQAPRPFSTDVRKAIQELNISLRSKFIEVPEDFRKRFEDDIIMSLQDIAGRSVAPSGRLFNSRPVYNDACSNNPLRHPFYKEEIIISTHDKVKVADFLDRKFRPLRRNKKRYIHIDQSVTTDSTGFASSYISRYVTVDGITKPVVAVELQLRINPPKPPKKISISKVRDFIFFMRDHWGLEIGKVTYDWYASQESMQVLEENGIKSSHQSVDRTDDAYMTFINMLYEGRIEMYDYVPSQKELFDLIHYRDRRKVDHPTGGSKDVMDAVVGSVWNALQDASGEASVSQDTEVMLNAMVDEEDEDAFSLNELLEGVL